ncbi:tyrosine-type recombinase/integrase, partial [Deltaproteobacteria bacterium TL4]
QAHIISYLKSLFQWAYVQGFLLYDPSVGLVAPRVPDSLPQQPLGLAEMESLCHLPDAKTPLGLRDRTMLEVLYATAMRGKELVSLAPSDVDQERQVVWIRQGKGQKDRVVPITPRALEWIQNYQEQVRQPLLGDLYQSQLFLNQHGKPLSVGQCQHRIKSYLRTLRPQGDGGIHLIRHSVATLLLENGCDTRYIQQLLGHSSLNTTQLYTRVAIPHLKEVYQKTHPAFKARKENS